MKSLLSALFLLLATVASAQNYFYFDDGGIVTPADESTIAQLDVITIDYTQCQGTGNGLALGTGMGKDWLLGPENKKYDVTLTDDYTNHILTLRVKDGPIVKAGNYKLTIPEGAINVYGNSSLICDAYSCRWTIDGSLDNGGPESLQLVSSYPAEGEAVQLPFTQFTLTFDQDVTVRHSAFDAAGRISNNTTGGYIQLNMKAEGNTITLTKGSYSSSDFIEGQHYTLELYAGHIAAAADPNLTLEATSINFSVASAGEDQGLHAIAQIPAAGENIHNAGSVTFNMSITKVDGDKVTLINENGHVAELSSVGRDGQATRNLIFNIAEGTHLQGNTTYKLHLEAGAVTAGQTTNEEMDAAYWCIPAELFSINSDMANSTVSELSLFTATFEHPELDYTIVPELFNQIKVTGVSTNANHTYATLSSGQYTEGQMLLYFEPTVTPELLAQGGALYNSVKVVIPEGAFIDSEGRSCRHSEFIVYVLAEKEIGAQTWTFDPASGSQLTKLGYRRTATEEDGTVTEFFYINFKVSGENVYARIPDGSKLTLNETLSGEQVREFARYDVNGYNNQFSLELGEAITETGIYQLTIPAEAIYLYSDPGYLGNPIHPAEPVVATWTVGDVEALQSVGIDPSTQPTYDLFGRPQSHSHGLHIQTGKVIYQ